MNNKEQGVFVGLTIAALVFLIILTIYGTVQSSLNTTPFSNGVKNLINLIPLVLVGVVIVGIIALAFRMSQ